MLLHQASHENQKSLLYFEACACRLKKLNHKQKEKSTIFFVLELDVNV